MVGADSSSDGRWDRALDDDIPLSPAALEVHVQVQRLAWISTRLETDVARLADQVSELALQLAELRGGLRVRSEDERSSWRGLGSFLRGLAGLR